MLHVLTHEASCTELEDLIPTTAKIAHSLPINSDYAKRRLRQTLESIRHNLGMINYSGYKPGALNS
ncbi:hypothetical protein M5D96_011322 [Drosophila gunungcola]|uniref:Uncharacterized protein n=1 Tax=Drosophila gunungcola TaxID=103775 RepID=A0A9P9YF71_9MUSC|nr:hypothetical protein M5D96_011322 [Drosophila gunungcola]